MKQTIRVIRPKGDLSSPDHIEVDCAFAIGQEHVLPYQIHPRRHSKFGYISAFLPGGYPALGKFVVRDLSVFLQNGVPKVLVELEALDPQFFCRYPEERKILLQETYLRSLLSQVPAPIMK